MKAHHIDKDPQRHGAHSGTRSGISDYNDGANVTDQLGNDDQHQNFGAFDSGMDNEEEEDDEDNKSDDEGTARTSS